MADDIASLTAAKRTQVRDVVAARLAVRLFPDASPKKLPPDGLYTAAERCVIQAATMMYPRCTTEAQIRAFARRYWPALTPGEGEPRWGDKRVAA